MILPMFQPIISIKEKVCIGAEVLSRWDFDGDILSPSDVEVGIKWDLVDISIADLLLEVLGTLDESYQSLLINVSELTLVNDESFDLWLDRIGRMQTFTGLKVYVEISSEVIDETLKARWIAMKSSGALLLMNDYGKRYSTFDRLKAYPWDACKIDVSTLVSGGMSAIPAIVHCGTYNISVFGRHIETEGHARLAAQLDIDFVQGHLYGEPAVIEVPENETEPLTFEFKIPER